MVSTIESGSELLKSLRIEAFSTIYKISVLVLIVIFIWSYRKYRVSEEIETHFSAFHLTWLSLGMCIACIFCFIGDNTDFFYEVFFDCIAVFMALYYLYSQYSNANKKGMSRKRWIQVFSLGIVDIILMVLFPLKIAMLIIPVQTLILIQYEANRKKSHH